MLPYRRCRPTLESKVLSLHKTQGGSLLTLPGRQAGAPPAVGPSMMDPGVQGSGSEAAAATWPAYHNTGGDRTLRACGRMFEPERDVRGGGPSSDVQSDTRRSCSGISATDARGPRPDRVGGRNRFGGSPPNLFSRQALSGRTTPDQPHARQLPSVGSTPGLGRTRVWSLHGNAYLRGCSHRWAKRLEYTVELR